MHQGATLSEGSECRVEPGGSFQTRVPIFYSQHLVAYHRGAETGLAFVKRQLCGDHEGVGPCPIDSIFLMCLNPFLENPEEATD